MVDKYGELLASNVIDLFIEKTVIQTIELFVAKLVHVYLSGVRIVLKTVANSTIIWCVAIVLSFSSGLFVVLECCSVGDL